MSAEPVPFGRYILLERVSLGSVGEVFLGRRGDGGGLVIVERPLAVVDDAPSQRAALVEATSRVAAVHHPNVAAVLDLGQVTGRTFVVSEHVAGLDLRAVLARARDRGTGRLPLPLACLVGVEIARGLDALHGAGIVHGDLSPGHVLLSFSGHVKLIDPGVVAALGTDEAKKGRLLRGRYGYQSPESIRGLPLEPASDVFSLGALLTELVCGRPLFVGRGDFHVVEQVRNLEVTPPRAIDRSIPAGLEEVLLVALSREPGDRYPTAAAFRDALGGFASGAGFGATADDLEAWLAEAFFDDRARLGARWAMLRERAVAPSKGPALDWDDDEAATHIYDRDEHGSRPAPLPVAPGPGVPESEMAPATAPMVAPEPSVVVADAPPPPPPPAEDPDEEPIVLPGTGGPFGGAWLVAALFAVGALIALATMVLGR